MVDIPFGRTFWPRNGELDIHKINPQGHIVLGICPHSNEPLGIIYLNLIIKILGKKINSVIFNIDPPPQNHKSFRIKACFDEFLCQFYLPKMESQVEFSFGLPTADHHFHASNQRALKIQKFLQSIPQVEYLMLHNDPFNSFFYCYLMNHSQCNHVNKIALYLAQKLNRCYGLIPQLTTAGWTDKWNEMAYHYFHSQQIDPHLKGESAGIYLNKNHIPTATLEIPMYQWNNCSNSLKNEAQKLFQMFIGSNLQQKEKEKITDPFKNKFTKIKMILPDYF